jgi:hypothetical protein
MWQLKWLSVPGRLDTFCCIAYAPKSLNKSILIVGGTSGMGLSAAIACKEAGASLVVVGRDAESAELARPQRDRRLHAQLCRILRKGEYSVQCCRGGSGRDADGAAGRQRRDNFKVPQYEAAARWRSHRPSGRFGRGCKCCPWTAAGRSAKARFRHSPKNMRDEQIRIARSIPTTPHMKNTKTPPGTLGMNVLRTIAPTCGWQKMAIATQVRSNKQRTHMMRSQRR